MPSRDPLPDVQVTPRLVLRPWRPDDPSDVEAAYDIYSREEVARFLGAVPTPDAHEDHSAARLRRWAALGDGVRGVWAMVPWGGADVPVGSALLLTLPRTDGEPSDADEIGWHLHPDAWGHGLATEAARAMLLRARAAGIGEVHAVVYADNHRSLALCDRLRMTRLGPTGRWYGVDLIDHVRSTGD